MHPECECGSILTYHFQGPYLPCPNCGRRWRKVVVDDWGYPLDEGDHYLEEMEGSEEFSRYYSVPEASLVLGKKYRQFRNLIGSGIVTIDLVSNGRDYFSKDTIDEQAVFMQADPRDYWLRRIEGEIVPTENQLLTSHLAAKMIPFSQRWLVEQVKRGIISGKIIGNTCFVNRGAVEEYRQLVLKYRK